MHNIINAALLICCFTYTRVPLQNVVNIMVIHHHKWCHTHDSLNTVTNFLQILTLVLYPQQFQVNLVNYKQI